MKKRFLKINFYQILKSIFSIVFLFNSLIINAQIYEGKVVKIKDGDTIVVVDSIGQNRTLRLAEIDSPENNQPYGEKSKQFTLSQVYHKIITYKITDIDRYGRAVAMVYYGVKKKYLSAELIKNGMAWHYKKYSKSEELASLEIQARKNKIGLWSDTNPISPSEWRKTKHL